MYLEARPGEQLMPLPANGEEAPVGLCFRDRHLRSLNLNDHLLEMDASTTLKYEWASRDRVRLAALIPTGSR
jgi:hypothetical protein